MAAPSGHQLYHQWQQQAAVGRTPTRVASLRGSSSPSPGAAATMNRRRGWNMAARKTLSVPVPDPPPPVPALVGVTAAGRAFF